MVKNKVFYRWSVVGGRWSGGLGNGGQMKIMQMSFMIIGVFFFFIMVGLFVMTVMLKDVRSGAGELAKEQAISSLKIIAAMPELSYNARDSMTIDEDKLRVMSGGFGESYGKFWPIASLDVYKIYPAFKEVVDCPAADCNHYSVYDSGQRNVDTFSAYVSICEKTNGFKDKRKCEVGKLVVGVKIRESEVGGR